MTVRMTPPSVMDPRPDMAWWGRFNRARRAVVIRHSPPVRDLDAWLRQRDADAVMDAIIRHVLDGASRTLLLSYCYGMRERTLDAALSDLLGKQVIYEWQGRYYPEAE